MGICTGSIRGILSVGFSCHDGESHGNHMENWRMTWKIWSHRDSEGLESRYYYEESYLLYIPALVICFKFPKSNQAAIGQLSLT